MLAARACTHQGRIENVSGASNERSRVMVGHEALPLGHVARRVSVVEMADGQSWLHNVQVLQKRKRE